MQAVEATYVMRITNNEKLLVYDTRELLEPVSGETFDSDGSDDPNRSACNKAEYGRYTTNRMAKSYGYEQGSRL
ncbi:hypothetical protein scyTo_0014965 [Scyliorhinus torazame]|uniref:Uncharacterized protein n=1 Tax=Scyliorhinus torazame TaxID=75743 RepID=A0A401NZ98_SCYTO|nr:hypothetical protein [Scyliorhinus torazame]